MRKAINLLIFSFLIVFVSCQNEQKTNTLLNVYESSDQLVEAVKKEITEISVDNFKKMYEGEDYFVLIDVRNTEEYDGGYIPGAANIDRGVLEFNIAKAEIWDELGLYIPEKTDRIVLYCRSGNRSALAAKALKELGYGNVISLQGGWKAWHEAYPELIEKIIVEEEPIALEAPVQKLTPVLQQAPKTTHAAGGC